MSQDDLRSRLESEIERAPWTWLQPHAEREAIIVVGPDLGLLDVACAVAHDEHNQVEKWLEDKSLTKPTVDQLRAWDRDPGQEFQFIILQPFVPIQALGH